MASPETRLKDWALKHFKGRGPEWLVEKRVGSPLTRRGKADLMVCFRGLHGECELKASAAERTTKLQDDWLDKCRRAGAVTAVAWSREQVIAWADALEAKAQALNCNVPTEE